MPGTQKGHFYYSTKLCFLIRCTRNSMCTPSGASRPRGKAPVGKQSANGSDLLTHVIFAHGQRFPSSMAWTAGGSLHAPSGSSSATRYEDHTCKARTKSRLSWLHLLCGIGLASVIVKYLTPDSLSSWRNFKTKTKSVRKIRDAACVALVLRLVVCSAHHDDAWLATVCYSCSCRQLALKLQSEDRTSRRGDLRVGE